MATFAVVGCRSNTFGQDFGHPLPASMAEFGLAEFTMRTLINFRSGYVGPLIT